jgi:hypothetical protein
MFAYSGLKSVLIPRTIELIEESCFRGASNLKTVEFEKESSLNRIESKAFEGTPISEIVVPEKVVFVGDECFGNCECLSKIECEGEVGKITFGERVFSTNVNGIIFVPSDDGLKGKFPRNYTVRVKEN